MNAHHILINDIYISGYIGYNGYIWGVQCNQCSHCSGLHMATHIKIAPLQMAVHIGHGPFSQSCLYQVAF